MKLRSSRAKSPRADKKLQRFVGRLLRSGVRSRFSRVTLPRLAIAPVLKDQRLEDLERENTELKATAETAAQEHAELIANLKQQAQQALAKSTTDSSNLVAQLRQQVVDERSATTVALEEARRLLREEQARSALLADPSRSLI